MHFFYYSFSGAKIPYKIRSLKNGPVINANGTRQQRILKHLNAKVLF